MSSTGDIGSATQIVLEGSKPKKQTQLTQTYLTITEANHAFEAIAKVQGSGTRTKKERLVTTLMSQASPIEAKYLVKIFTWRNAYRLA